EQAAVFQVLKKRRENSVQEGQEVALEHEEVLLVRVPVTAAARLGVYRHKRGAGFHQPPGHQQAGAIEIASIAVAQDWRLFREVKCLPSLAGCQTRQRLPLLLAH